MNPASLDYETTSQYNLTITASDPDGLTSMQMVTMDIKDVNEAPVIQNLPATLTIDEDVVGYRMILSVETTDPDDDVIVYTMSTSPSLGPFEINTAGKHFNHVGMLQVVWITAAISG